MTKYQKTSSKIENLFLATLLFAFTLIPIIGHLS